MRVKQCKNEKQEATVVIPGKLPSGKESMATNSTFFPTNQQDLLQLSLALSKKSPHPAHFLYNSLPCFSSLHKIFLLPLASSRFFFFFLVFAAQNFFLSLFCSFLHPPEILLSAFFPWFSNSSSPLSLTPPHALFSLPKSCCPSLLPNCLWILLVCVTYGFLQEKVTAPAHYLIHLLPKLFKM